MSLPAWRVTAVVLVLSACTSLEPERPAAPERSFAAHENRLRAITHWEMRGRIAVDTGSEARQGRFTWWQDGESLRVVIRGPLGTQAVQIDGDREALRLRARRQTRTLSDPETQLSEMLGWWLPISSLPSWLLGLPDPRFPATSAVIDAELLRDLNQRAWRVSYTDYAQQGSTPIPAGITFTHAPLQLVVTVDEWVDRTGASLELDGERRAQ